MLQPGLELLAQGVSSPGVLGAREGDCNVSAATGLGSALSVCVSAGPTQPWWHRDPGSRPEGTVDGALSMKNASRASFTRPLLTEAPTGMPRAPTGSRSGTSQPRRARSESRFKMPSAADVALMDDSELDAAFPSREAPTLPGKKPLDPIPLSRPGSSEDDLAWRLHQQFAASAGIAGAAPGASFTPRGRAAQPEELVAQLSDVDGRAAAATKLDGMLRRERVAGGTEAHAALVSRLVAGGVVPPLVTALSSQRPAAAAEAAAALVRSLAVSADAKAALLRAGALVPLVRLVEAADLGGSAAAQDALDRLAMCDGAVKAQIAAAQAREGAAARVDALRLAQQRRAEAAAAAVAAVGGFAAGAGAGAGGDGGAGGAAGERDEEADEIDGLAELAADAEEAAQVAAAGGVELLVARVASGANAGGGGAKGGGGAAAGGGGGDVDACGVYEAAAVAAAGVSARAVAAAARALCALAEHASLRTALATARATPALVALLSAGSSASGPGGIGAVGSCGGGCDAAAALATPLARAWAAAALCTLARSQAPKQEALALGAMPLLLALLDGGPAGGAVDGEVAAVLEQVRRLAPGTLLPGRA